MATDKKNSTAKVDSIPWVIKDTTGSKIGSESWNTYTEANTAAKSYTRESGSFAQAVRS